LIIGDILDALSNIRYVRGCQPSYTDSTILCHVDMVLLNHSLRLCNCQTSE
jgi:hypothetical protein